MPSPRSLFESVCRVGAFAVLGWLLGATLIPASGRRVERATTAALPAHLPGWTRAGANVALHGDFATTPPGWAVDWLAALAHSGHQVTWSGSPPSVAMNAEAAPEPDGGTRINISAPHNTTVVLRDDASVIDSVRITQFFGATVAAPTVVGTIVGVAANQRFSIAPPDSNPTRSIVVIGQAGWEGKFVVAALEADGWPVVTRFSVAPNVDVGQSGALSLDTSRVAAVVAIDTSIARYGDAVARFVHDGGGLVLAGPSGLSSSISMLAPGTLAARTRPLVEPTDTISLGSTGLYPISALKSDGVVLERRAAGVAVAARRVGAGRVIQLGYDDSWRWRMAGAPGSERAHREWWSRVVAAVAYVPEHRSADAATSESAPLARMVDRIGESRTAAPDGGSHGPVDRRIYLTLIMILLLMEWGSRRTRGMR